MNDYKEIIVKEYRNEKGLTTRREIGKEIVRCKDCKYCEDTIVAVTNNGEITRKNICHRFKMSVDAKHFCSYGKRQEHER